MVKDALYFSHDYNARNDRKIAALVRKYKSSGYGIFWATCEMMHEEGGELEMDDITYEAIAKDLSEEFEIVKRVVEDCIATFKLFTLDEQRLNSNRVNRNLHKRQEVIEQRSVAGKKSGEVRRQKKTTVEQNRTTVQQPLNKIEQPFNNRSTTVEQNLTNVEQTGTDVEQNRTKKERKKESNKEINTSDDFIFCKKPLPNHFNGLPKEKIYAALEAHTLSFGTGIIEGDVDRFWKVFKIESLTGENFYESEEKVYTHFIRWIKKQSLNKLQPTQTQPRINI